MMAFGGSRNEENTQMLQIDREGITHDWQQFGRIASS
jgi:hypothetical protein